MFADTNLHSCIYRWKVFCSANKIVSGQIRYCAHSRAALRQIGLSERHANSRRVLRWIKATGKTEVAIKDIRRDALVGALDADQTESLVEALTRAGWLRPDVVKPSGPKGGKPVRRWQVNPLLWAAETAETAET